MKRETKNKPEAMPEIRVTSSRLPLLHFWPTRSQVSDVYVVVTHFDAAEWGPVQGELEGWQAATRARREIPANHTHSRGVAAKLVVQAAAKLAAAMCDSYAAHFGIDDMHMQSVRRAFGVLDNHTKQTEPTQ